MRIESDLAAEIESQDLDLILGHCRTSSCLVVDIHRTIWDAHVSYKTAEGFWWQHMWVEHFKTDVRDIF
jgi:hypothetical protein